MTLKTKRKLSPLVVAGALTLCAGGAVLTFGVGASMVAAAGGSTRPAGSGGAWGAGPAPGAGPGAWACSQRPSDAAKMTAIGGEALRKPT